MEMQVPLISNEPFYIDKTTKKLVAEHSDLGNCNLFNQLYDDACDAGIAIVNPNTGNITRWYHHDTVRDQDGDVIVFSFKPTSETIRRNPIVADYEVRILND